MISEPSLAQLAKSQRSNWLKFFIFITFWGVMFLIGGWYLGSSGYLVPNFESLVSPLRTEPEKERRTLEMYSIPNLRSYPFQTNPITIQEEVGTFPDYTSYIFTFQTLDRTMSGQINIPTSSNLSGLENDEQPVIILIRGWAPEAGYSTGFGTRSAAARFAQAGYVTLAPDFFGFGLSDPEPEDSWQARFEKPIAIIELLKSVKEIGLPNSENDEFGVASGVGFWAHSNGGQITLSVLQILGESYPATLWAPVTAPFPYSILYFSADHEDEGKAMRLWVAQLERDYDLFDYSVTQHLDSLQTPLIIHHGGLDTDAPISWSESFAKKVENENERREKLVIVDSQEELLTGTQASPQAIASSSAQSMRLETAIANSILLPIDFTFYRYPGADHNLRPNWNQAIERDLEFFMKHL